MESKAIPLKPIPMNDCHWNIRFNRNYVKIGPFFWLIVDFKKYNKVKEKNTFQLVEISIVQK
jgi:hypothetical protein